MNFKNSRELIAESVSVTSNSKKKKKKLQTTESLKNL